MNPFKITIECDEAGQMEVEEQGTLWDVTLAYASCLRSLLDRADKTAGGGAEIALSEFASQILREPIKKMDFTTVKLEDFKQAIGKEDEE